MDNYSILISYQFDKETNFTVQANLEHIKKTEDRKTEDRKPQRGTLSVTVKDLQTGRTVERNEKSDVIPFACMTSSINLGSYDADGGAFIVSALYTPLGATSPIWEEKKKIQIYGKSGSITASYSYELLKAVTMGKPAVFSLESSSFMLIPAEGFELIGEPEDATLTCSIDKGTPVCYSGPVQYDGSCSSFSSFPCGTGEEYASADITFSCNTTFGRCGEEDSRRQTAFSFSLNTR